VSGRSAAAPPFGSGRASALTAILLAAVSFVVTYWITLQLYDQRIFYRWDVWFDADPNLYLPAFADGTTSSWVILRHPLLIPLIYPVVRVVAWLVSALGLSGASEQELRVWAALLVVPVANALRTALWFLVFRRMFDRLRPVVLLCLLELAAFATVSVGSVPESFPLSATCIAAMFWLMMDDAPRPRWLRAMSWLAVGTVAVGVTVTNVIPLVALLGGTLFRRRVGIVRASGMLAAALLVAMLVSGLAALRGVGSRDALEEGVLQTQNAVRPISSLGALRELAWSVAHTFVAPRPGERPYFASPAQGPHEEYIFSYSAPYRHGMASLWRAMLTAVVLAIGVMGWRRHQDRVPLLAVPAAIIGGNLVLHLFFGEQFALYMLHWSGALLWVVAGAAMLNRQRPARGTLVLDAFTLVTAVNSAWLIRLLLDQLRVA
jgi:hypothetical protein